MLMLLKNGNVIKKYFGSLHKPLLNLCSISLQNEIFPDELKIARVTLLFNNRNNSGLGDYIPISLLVLPCFSKVLEKIMCNRLYKHLIYNNILLKKNSQPSM